MADFDFAQRTVFGAPLAAHPRLLGTDELDVERARRP
jgi:hypothetical protein